MPKDKEQKLTIAWHRLTLALDSEAIKINKKVAIKANLDNALAREIELKKEIESLSTQKAKFTASSTLCDAELASNKWSFLKSRGRFPRLRLLQL